MQSHKQAPNYQSYAPTPVSGPETCIASAHSGPTAHFWPLCGTGLEEIQVTLACCLILGGPQPSCQLFGLSLCWAPWTSQGAMN